MPAYESRHLLRLLRPSEEVAAEFIKYCRNHKVITRGLCRIGYVNRTPPPQAATTTTASGASSSAAIAILETHKLRGLIAAKDIAKDENIAVLPEGACLHPGTAMRCREFLSLFPTDIQQRYFLSPEFVQNSRVSDRALVRHNQLLLAFYMAYLIVLRARTPARLSSMNGGDAIAYLDFMPRMEGDFEQLAGHLDGWIHSTEVSRVGLEAIAEACDVTPAEVRQVVLFALCMIYSRMVPVDHRATLRFAFRETPLAGAYTESTYTEGSPLVEEPISFLCPIIDMCNHSDSENVAVMVPELDASVKSGPVICLRSLRDIAKGEELTMTYGASPRELHLIWGMREFLQ